MPNTLTKLIAPGGLRACVSQSGETIPGLFTRCTHTGVCVVSQSGETKDTHRALLVSSQAAAPTFSIVNQVRTASRDQGVSRGGGWCRTRLG